MSLRALSCMLVAAITCACARSSQPPALAAAAKSPVELYFPLVDGTIFTYQGGAHDEMFMVRVKRTGPSTAQLITGDSVKMLSVSPTSVRRDSAGALLQSPLEIGASWQGDHGTVRIVDLHAQVQVPAGSFKHCLHTLEEVGGDVHGRIDTWFCPDVGIAKMIVEQWQAGQAVSVTTELRAFGPSVDLRK